MTCDAERVTGFVDGELDAGTVLRKVTAFAPFDGAARNQQEHVLYLGDLDALNVEAAATLSRYLREGKDIPAERRRQVEDQIGSLESFLVDLEVTGTANTTITVDGREVGRTPLPAPVRFAAAGGTAGRERVAGRP